eukprot:756973-Hanusia_phi.AAC.6
MVGGGREEGRVRGARKLKKDASTEQKLNAESDGQGDGDHSHDFLKNEMQGVIFAHALYVYDIQPP